MKFNVTFAPLAEPQEPSDILTEARAKIIWGEDVASVRSFLISNGVSSSEADARIKHFLSERNTTIRKVAIKNAIIGGILLAGMIVFIFISVKYPSPMTMTNRWRGPAGAMVAGLYGLYKLVNGIIYFIRPQFEDQSVTKIE